MPKKLVFDLPTRLFHWAFAGLFIVAFMIAKTVDDDNPTFSYHMLAGIMLGALVLFRLVWGAVGTKYARFSSFALHPGDIFGYLKGVLTGDGRRWAGHNPASSWAAVLMMVFALGLAVTGYFMASGGGETFEDLHELLANGFLVVVLVHIAGVLIHTLRHRDGIAFAMVNGQKQNLGLEEGIQRNQTWVALLLLVSISVFAGYLNSNYNPNSRELNLFGKMLMLGEAEEGSDDDD